MLEELRNNNKLIIGTKQSLRAVKENTAQTVFVAKDAEKHVVRPIEEYAKENEVQIVYAESMKKLGKACGISVGAAVAVMLK